MARKSSVVIIVAIAVVVVIAYLMANASIATLPNLTATDISSAIKGASYYPVVVDQINRINNPSISTYLETSISIFNSTVQYIDTNSSYPSTIDSSVIMMNNDSSAHRVVNDTVKGLNVGKPGLQGQIVSGVQQYTYSAGNSTVTMIIIPTVAIFNRTILHSVGNRSTIPIYQFVTLFSYKNKVGSVEISGYNQNLNESIAIVLTKALYSRLADH